MRVLALTNLYPNPFQPHRAPFNRHQFRLLAEKAPVRVVAPVAWMDEWFARRRGAARLPRGRCVQLDGLTVHHPRYLYTPKCFRAHYGRFYLWSVGRTVRNVAAEFRPTLLFAPWAYPDGWAAVRLARHLNVPVVVQVHGSDVKLLTDHPKRRAGTAAALRAANRVIAVSQDLARDVVRLGVDESRVRVVYDGVDTTLFKPGNKTAARAQLGWPPDDRVVLFVGNLVPVKNVRVLIEAIAALNRAGLPVRGVIAGAGPLRRALEERTRDCQVTEKITFVGAVPQTDLPTYYQAADLFALPSRSEGVPNVLLEASACGLPWVASEVGGIPEIVRRGNGLLVPPGEVPALTVALQTILTRSHFAALPPPKPRSAAVEELHAILTEAEAN